MSPEHNRNMASYVVITIYIKFPIRSTEKCKFACMALLYACKRMAQNNCFVKGSHKYDF